MHYGICSKSEDDFDIIGMRKRIKFARNNGINTCIITGTGEALQNKKFLRNLARLFSDMGDPFPNIELQTSGVFILNKKGNLDHNNIELLQSLGVNTISVSVSDVFDDNKNLEIMGVPKNLEFDLPALCKVIKKCRFNLRLSLNMTDNYDNRTPYFVLRTCKELGADQITFRKLYRDNSKSAESRWVADNACDKYTIDKLNEYIAGKYYHADQIQVDGKGTKLYRLPFGAMVYSVMEMSVVIDGNCMSKEENEKLKYVILREDGKLYAQWDDKGSLIF